MRKIRLDPDALEVFSFATDAAARSRGTVQGRSGYSFHHTHCGCPESYYAEESCTCHEVLPTQSLARECLVINPPAPTQDVTCFTCPGIHPGC